MRSRRLFRISLLGLVLAITAVSRSLACESGDNFFTHSGLLSRLWSDIPSSVSIPFSVPAAGERYEVKINFLKVETSATAIDAAVDYLNKEAIKRGDDHGSAFWDRVREQLKQVKSDAYFELFDEDGQRLGRVDHLEALTFFKTIKFRAQRKRYTVHLVNLSGAGLYHLTAECD